MEDGRIRKPENHEEQRQDVATGDAAVDKRARRTMSPHGRRVARRSDSDERQERTADLVNRASAAPGERARNATMDTSIQQSLQPTRADDIVSAGG